MFLFYISLLLCVTLTFKFIVNRANGYNQVDLPEVPWSLVLHGFERLRQCFPGHTVEYLKIITLYLTLGLPWWLSG